MNDIFHFAKSSFKWHYKRFVIVNLLVLTCLFLMEKFPVLSHIPFMAMFFIVLMYSASNSLFGEINSNGGLSLGGYFSGKYLQALPISKMRFILTLAISNSYVLIPTIVSITWLVTRWKGNEVSAFKEIFTLISENYFSASILLFLFYFTAYFCQTSTVIEIPRKAYSKGSFSNILILIKEGTKLVAVMVIIASLGLYSVAYKTLWLSIIVISGCMIYEFWRSCQLLLREELSYWNTKRDLGHIFIYIAVIILPPFLLFNKIDYDYNKTSFRFYYSQGPKIFSSAVKNEWEHVENYISNGGDLGLENEKGVSLVHALSLADFEKVNGLEDRFLENTGLLKKPIKINKSMSYRYSDGVTPIHLLSAGNSSHILQKAINKNLDFLKLKTTELQYTPLHYASIYCSYRSAKILLEKGADVNSKNSLGNTPLMTASENGCSIVAILLIKKGADLDLENNDGKTALELAKEAKYGKKVHFLLETLSNGF